MSTLKTQPNKQSAKKFLDETVLDPARRKDCDALLNMMRTATGTQPKMWGSSIIGFGSYHYKYASGREGDWFLTGFSPRKQAMVLYVMAGFDRYNVLMKSLGKYKTGKACLYIKKLDDVNVNVLQELIKSSVDYLTKKSADNE